MLPHSLPFKILTASLALIPSNNLEMAFKMFFNGVCNKPKLKSKKTDKMSFYVRYDCIKFRNNTVHFEKIGKIKYLVICNTYIIDYRKG